MRPVVLLSSLLLTTLPVVLPAPAEDEVVVRGVSIVDVVSGEIQRGMTIRIAQGRIQSVVADSAAAPRADALVVDAEGQYAMPGLWDMHIHWYHMNLMQLFPLNGVTGVRIMWGSPLHHSWRKSFEKGTVLGPRLVIASEIIDGPDPIWPGSFISSDAQTGRDAANRARETKSDFVKVYSLLPREAYFAIARQCRENQLPFCGHVPAMVSAREASDAGQRSIEHLSEILLACAADEQQLRALRQQRLDGSATIRDLLADRSLHAAIQQRSLDTFDEAQGARAVRTTCR